MQQNYKAFVDRMIEHYEGGYGWDKADAGGPTKYGITCYDLAENRGRKMTSMTSWAPLVRAMTLQEAEDIYAKKYAIAVRFADLPSGVDCVMFDYGVNSGPARPIRVARALLKTPGPDRVDVALLNSIRQAGPMWLINAMCDERMHFLQGLRNWNTFKGGWTARVKDLREYALAVSRKGLAPQTVVPVPAPPVNVPAVPKATHVESATPTAQGGTLVSTGVGVVAVSSGLPWEIAVLVVVAGVVATACYVFWKRSQQKQADTVVVLPGIANAKA